MAAARGCRWSRWAASDKRNDQLHGDREEYAFLPDKSALEEVNLLMKSGLKRAEFSEEEKWWGEDGFPPDDDDPLEYVTEGNLPLAEPYQVLYKMIAIRKQPSAEAKVLGTAQMGDILPTYDWDPTRTWRKTHFILRGGWGRRVAAWVMVRHPNLGLLVKATAQIALEEAVANGQTTAEPQPYPEPEKAVQEGQGRSTKQEPLASPADAAAASQAARAAPLTSNPYVPTPVGPDVLEEAARKLEDLVEQMCEQDDEADLPTESSEGFKYATVAEMDEAAEHGGFEYQVVHKPFVAMRHIALQKGRIVGSLDYGTYLDTFGWDKRKKWRKVFCQMPQDGRIIVAWIMCQHPELGALLEPAAG